jgi:putative phosphoesterase
MAGAEMILGVISDTHGNVRLMHRVADLLFGKLAAEVVIHLGDDYADAGQLEMAGHTVWAVPGLWCPEYHSYRVPKARVETVDGGRIAFAHADRDIALVRAGADLLLTGHTHSARIALEGGAVCMNPGHLRRSTDRGEHASFGLVTVSQQGFVCAIHEADGRVRLVRRYERGPSGCFVPAQ